MESSHPILLERTADNTISDIPADQIYSRALENSGESLSLKDDQAVLIDHAIFNTGWPVGSGRPNYFTMERIDPFIPGIASNWAPNDGVTINGLDADSTDLNGTPKAQNSAFSSSPQISITKTDTLLSSLDSHANPGEILKYTITLSNTGGSANNLNYSNAIPINTSLVASSAVIDPPTAGTGNSGPNVDIDVPVLNVDIITIMFQVEIDNPFPLNVYEISCQGNITGGNFTAIVTDDPDTPAIHDSTQTTVCNLLIDAGPDIVFCSGDTVVIGGTPAVQGGFPCLSFSLAT